MERETARTAEKETGAPGKIGAAEVRAAAEVLRRYRLGKQNLDRRIIDNEQFWKLRHWEQMDKAGEGGRREDIRPASGWLVNCILSKHADAMDCYPEPTVLPREPNDRREAEELSRILQVILKNNRFKKAYSQAWWNKLKSGCAVYGVFWDGDKLHGLGDVSIRSMDVLNLFWEPGVQDIQESENFFCTELVPNRRLEREYPQLDGVFCTNDDLAVGAAFECQRLGLKVPDDMAIAGFHGHDIGQVMEPRLASVLTPRERMGSIGAERLLARIRGESVTPKMLDLGFTLSLDYEPLDGGARLYEVPAEVMSGIMDAWQTAYPMQVYAPQEASAADSGNACILLLP